jgi:hypothetical protein
MRFSDTFAVIAAVLVFAAIAVAFTRNVKAAGSGALRSKIGKTSAASLIAGSSRAPGSAGHQADCAA